LVGYNGTSHQLFIDFEKAYDSVGREVLCNTVIQIGQPTEPVTLIKICLNETYSKVRIGKNVSDALAFQNGLKQADVSSPLFFNIDMISGTALKFA